MYFQISLLSESVTVLVFWISSAKSNFLSFFHLGKSFAIAVVVAEIKKSARDFPARALSGSLLWIEQETTKEAKQEGRQK